MIRVHILVEGDAEVTFVKAVLLPHFIQGGIHLLPRRLGKPRHKRGICAYPLARREVLITLKQEAQAFCTTMFDYYAMPHTWPKRKEAKRKPFAERADMIEAAILADVSAKLGDRFNCSRFVPYVQMHEFEALLFSDPSLLAKGLDLTDDSEVQRIRNQFQSPEEIDDSEQTAPSKRIKQLNAGYSKVRQGVLVSQKIGLSAMRAQCPHFDGWIARLEALAGC